MLYGKIFLDRDESGEEAIIFVSLIAEGDEKYLASSVDYIAISPEAKEKLSERLASTDRIMMRLFGDFELFATDEWDHGEFHFKPDSISDGQNRRTLRDSDPVKIKVLHGCRRAVVDYMIPADNEYLKNLDLSLRVDENSLWEIHFAKMRERGEEPACTVEAIKRMPPAFLTEEQIALIRADYKERRSGYSEYDLYRNPDAIDGMIIRDMSGVYAKSGTVLEKILGITLP
jgi:hypothetical protein